MFLQLINVRLAFPHLFVPHPDSGGYGALFIVDDESSVFIGNKSYRGKAEIEKACTAVALEVAKDKWPKIAAQAWEQIKAGNKWFLKDGVLKSQYDGFEGNLFVSANNAVDQQGHSVQPALRDERRELITNGAQSGKLYAGCYCHANLEIWGQDNKFGKRINAALPGVMHFRKGDAFSGAVRPSADKDFEALPEAPEDDQNDAMGASGGSMADYI